MAISLVCVESTSFVPSVAVQFEDVVVGSDCRTSAAGGVLDGTPTPSVAAHGHMDAVVRSSFGDVGVAGISSRVASGTFESLRVVVVSLVVVATSPVVVVVVVVFSVIEAGFVVRSLGSVLGGCTRDAGPNGQAAASLGNVTSPLTRHTEGVAVTLPSSSGVIVSFAIPFTTSLLSAMRRSCMPTSYPSRSLLPMKSNRSAHASRTSAVQAVPSSCSNVAMIASLKTT